MTSGTQRSPVATIPDESIWGAEKLASEIDRRAAILAQNGVIAGKYVVILHGGAPNFFADLFAVWRLGACAVCLDPSTSEFQLDNVMDFVSPCLLLADQTFASNEDLRVPVLNTSAEVPPNALGGLGSVEFGNSLDSPALILFTSGTTGTPKGVVHSFRSLVARIALNRSFIGDDPLTNSLCLLPTHFGHGLIGNCLTPLFAGKRLVIAPFSGIKSAMELPTLIDDHEITFMSSVPTVWKLVGKVGKRPKKGTLRHVGIGSAPLSSSLWKEVVEWSGTDNVWNMYGITELANWAAGASARDYEPEDGLVGRMWGGGSAMLGEDGAIRASGEGEILVQTPSLMTGYFRLPELTADAIQNGWFKTGDTGSIDSDGVIRIAGRKKNEINRAGVKIQPEEVDSILERHSDVLEACTFGLPDAISGEVVAAAVVRVDGKRLDSQTLKDWCAKHLRREQIPEKWYWVEEIPKSDRGKVNRQKVMDYCISREKS